MRIGRRHLEARPPGPPPAYPDNGGGHRPWCSEDPHRCGLGEHRSDPHAVDVPGAGRAVVTRVRGRDGREHAEVRLTVPLAVDEPGARRQLAALLDQLARVMVWARRTA